MLDWGRFYAGGKTDFLETAGEKILERIACARQLTRKYDCTDYRDTAKRTAILKALLGSLGENVAIDTPFYYNIGKNIFIGNDVIINMTRIGKPDVLNFDCLNPPRSYNLMLFTYRRSMARDWQ